MDIPVIIPKEDANFNREPVTNNLSSNSVKINAMHADHAHKVQSSTLNPTLALPKL